MTTDTWKGPSGTTSNPKTGKWQTAGNWSTGQVPGDGVGVLLDGTTTSSYTVTLNHDTNDLLYLQIADSHATLALGTSGTTGTGHTVTTSGTDSNGYGIENSGTITTVGSGETSTLSVSSGGILNAGTIDVATGDTLDVTGAAAEVYNSGTITL